MVTIVIVFGYDNVDKIASNSSKLLLFEKLIEFNWVGLICHLENEKRDHNLVVCLIFIIRLVL